MRTNLLEKLQKPVPNHEPVNDCHKPLYQRDKFLACIVREYLIKSKKEYSLSILLPESNLEEEDCLNFNELAEIINLNKMEISQNGERSFLEVLVDEWTKFRAVEINERSTQTDYSEPVSKKLEDIEKHYSKQIDYWKLIPGKKETEKDKSLAVKEEKMRE